MSNKKGHAATVRRRETRRRQKARMKQEGQKTNVEVIITNPRFKIPPIKEMLIGLSFGRRAPRRNIPFDRYESMRKDIGKLSSAPPQKEIE